MFNVLSYCEYTFCRRKDGENDGFEFDVTVENIACGYDDETICSKIVTLKLFGQTTIRLARGSNVTLNERDLTSNYNVGNIRVELSSAYWVIVVIKVGDYWIEARYDRG